MNVPRTDAGMAIDDGIDELAKVDKDHRYDEDEGDKQGELDIFYRLFDVFRLVVHGPDVYRLGNFCFQGGELFVDGCDDV